MGERYGFGVRVDQGAIPARESRRFDVFLIIEAGQTYRVVMDPVRRDTSHLSRVLSRQDVTGEPEIDAVQQDADCYSGSLLQCFDFVTPSNK